MEVYNVYSTYLKDKHGGKVYKIPVNLPISCPNRDGTCGTGGCTFCGDIGAGYEMKDSSIDISTQIEENIAKIGKRYNAKMFIAYLQNFSNTYMPTQMFENVLEQIKGDEFVGISVSTRPDCINDKYLDILKKWSEKYGKSVCVELGLQTVNYKTLDIINRGHGLAEYLDAMLRIKAYGFESCTHIILDLPWDDMRDTIETAKCVSALGTTYVKLHSLYIVKGTKLAKEYEAGNLNMLSLEEYKERVKTFLRYLSPDIVVQRIIGRAPEEFTLRANWGTSWWKIHDDIVREMQEAGYHQGQLCDYLNGKAVQKFI